MPQRPDTLHRRRSGGGIHVAEGRCRSTLPQSWILLRPAPLGIRFPGRRLENEATRTWVGSQSFRFRDQSLRSEKTFGGRDGRSSRSDHFHGGEHTGRNLGKKGGSQIWLPGNETAGCRRMRGLEARAPKQRSRTLPPTFREATKHPRPVGDPPSEWHCFFRHFRDCRAR